MDIKRTPGTKANPYVTADGTEMRMVNFLLPVETAKRLRILAAQKDIPVSRIAREAIDEWLARGGGDV